MLQQITPRSARRGLLITTIAALLALVAAGALTWQLTFRTRGIPPGLPDPIPHAGAAPGLNVYFDLTDNTAWDAEMTAIRDLGVETIKQPFYFHEEFNWEGAAALLETAVAHDLTLVPLLDGDPANQFAPPPPAEFAAWTGEFAARFGDHLRYYIIWDEPNLTSHWGGEPVNALEYSALLAAAAEAIRAADGDAVIVAAPLAPTIETGPHNLAEPLFLQEMYAAGAAPTFDIAAGKPYGFDFPPTDRTVDENRTNFSRIILLREVMVANGDGEKAVWAGNWGWNSLPAAWSGPPSIWGEVSGTEKAAYTVEGLVRAQQEWPWLGLMFLENWQPDGPADDPRWGFAVKETAVAPALAAFLAAQQPGVALPGYHLASDQDPAQQYRGDWEFSPLGADIGQHPDEQLLGDSMSFTFWGTDLGLRLRRADFRARLYVTVDGRPANALPRDENGSTLVLTSAVPGSDILATEWVARDLPPGEHTVEIVASRGWDQWALNGFLVAYHPPQRGLVRGIGLLLGSALLLLAGSALLLPRAALGALWRQGEARFGRLAAARQAAWTIGSGLLLTAAGWLTWGVEMGGMYRRLGDGPQLALATAAAAVYYVTPTFFIFLAALLALFVMLSWRPQWGLVLIALAMPFYVTPLAKPILNYRFSPVEVLTLLSFGAFLTHKLLQRGERIRAEGVRALLPRGRLRVVDVAVLFYLLVATLSLFFTERVDVASNEWRVVILEPVLFYFLMRGIRPSERTIWWMIDAFVLSGVIIAGYGFWQLAFDRAALITAEGGILRVRSIFGSPNNVALYLGRIMPFLGAVALFGAGKRRWLYAITLLPLGLIFLLTFSKGGLFLGLPAAFLFIFAVWQRAHRRLVWPWFFVFTVLGAGGLWVVGQVPALAGRLSLFGETGVFRLNLWRSSLQMIAERPWFGVGLDNFLTAYRSRYIFEAAWREPNLSHPHNLWLDLATRLGLLGFVSGTALIGLLANGLRRSWAGLRGERRPLAIGTAAALVYLLAHGLVDHAIFLVDLSFVFFLLLGLSQWLERQSKQNEPADPA